MGNETFETSRDDSAKIELSIVRTKALQKFKYCPNCGKRAVMKGV